MSWGMGTGLRNLLRRQKQADKNLAVEDWDESIPVANGNPALVAPKSLWTEAVPVSGQKVLPPDPRMMRTIGLNHSFESAIADVIDNSLDAHASIVLVRFLRDKERLLGLCVIDNGDGMDEETIDRAMTIGGRRTYSARDLGHFGIGLKAASLGQARTLTVVSKARGCEAVGRRWLMENAESGFACDTLDSAYSSEALDRYWEKPAVSGTVVTWTDVKSFPRIAHGKNSTDRIVDERLTRLRHHLGVVFHRLIASGRFAIELDVEEVETGTTGIRFIVEPIDPFGYLRSGRKDYPRLLKTSWNGKELDFKCHIWPGRSNHPNFRLPGGRPEQFQGFFIYRNDRLLQHGGWNGVLHADKDLQLGRIEIEIQPEHEVLFQMNAEKTRIEVSPHFGSLVQEASDGSHNFLRYVEDAKTSYRDSQKRKRERPKIVRPGKGLDEAVREAVSDEYEFLQTDEPLSILWVDLRGDTFFDVDRANMVVRLNKRYRAAVLGNAKGSLNDAPLVKALLYLLTEEAFRGAILSAKARDKISVWQSILTAAAQAEVE